jgi:murein DD-endopeptidase MepM/ murein hydrolase activator NlpD
MVFFVISLSGCNLPEPRPIDNESSPTAFVTEVAASAESTRTPAVEFTPAPPTLTSTPIPCDPLAVDYCISDWRFIFIRPILPPDNVEIDLSYPYTSTQNGRRDAHHGVEFQNAFGTPVHAAGDGEVVFADSDKAVKLSPWNNFYGNVVVIRHAGELFTMYAHLSNILVKAGNQVRAGDVIGNIGMTGGATGPHLHFEVRMGSDYTAYFSTQNPELWLSPVEGTGAISITLLTRADHNYEHPMVVTHLSESSDDAIHTYYIKSYSKGFEHNQEDAVLNNLPAGRYKIALNDASGLNERFVILEADRLTEVIFVVK